MSVLVHRPLLPASLFPTITAMPSSPSRTLPATPAHVPVPDIAASVPTGPAAAAAAMLALGSLGPRVHIERAAVAMRLLSSVSSGTIRAQQEVISVRAMDVAGLHEQIRELKDRLEKAASEASDPWVCFPVCFCCLLRFVESHVHSMHTLKSRADQHTIALF